MPKPEPSQRYRRPYEGTDVDTGAMQAYLDWEFGLVEQLRRDFDPRLLRHLTLKLNSGTIAPRFKELARCV